MGEHGASNGDRDLARLLRLAGRRVDVDPVRAARVERAVRSAWRAHRARRGLRLRLAAIGLAAAVLIAIAASWPRTPAVAATVELARGATVSGRVLARGDAVAVGETVNSAGGRVALRLANGLSLRLDHDSVLRFTGDGAELTAGAAYIDHLGDGAGLALRTPFGAIVQHGTQYEARIDDAGLSLRVREGAIALTCDAGEFPATAGERVSLADPAGAIVRGTIAADDPAWDWAGECAHAPALDGATLADALTWLCRERGWKLAYDAGLAERAASTRLHGLPADLSPRDALDYLLPPCGLAASNAGGRLAITLPTENAP
ncbi:MAG TPA: FecR family protein [Planctomycetota bacterium]|nr:FecR family protein [Planctomycetota bacterium]